MAKPKNEENLTAKQKVTLDMRQKLSLANDAHAKTPTKATEAAIATAKFNLAVATKDENRERFVNVVGNRLKKARIAIRNLAEISARSYEFTTEDVSKAVDTLNAETKKAGDKMAALLVKGGATAPDIDNVFAQ